MDSPVGEKPKGILFLMVIKVLLKVITEVSRFSLIGPVGSLFRSFGMVQIACGTVIILTTGLTYSQKIIRFAKDAKNDNLMPYGTGKAQFQVGFVSCFLLFYVTDTGHGVLQGTTDQDWCSTDL